MLYRLQARDNDRLAGNDVFGQFVRECEVEEYIRETRQSIWKLRSPKLDRGDLASALRQTGERATSGTPVKFTLTTTGQAPRMTLVVDGRPIETWVLEAGLGSWREATYTASIRTAFGRPVLALRFTDTLDRRSPSRLQHAYVDRIQLRWIPETGAFREGRPPGPIGPARTTTPRDGEFGGTIEVGETDLLRANRVPVR